MNITSFDGRYIFFGHNFDENPSPDNFNLHSHENFEIYYFISGKGTFWVEGNPYPLQSGDILFFNSGEAHYIDICPTAPYERVTINFTLEAIGDIIDSSHFLYAFKNREHGKNNLIKGSQFPDGFYRRCIKKMEENLHGSEQQMLANLLPLLNEICNVYKNEESNSFNHTEYLSSKIIRYINENISDAITPDSIAKNFFISRSQLYSIFKKTTSTSVWDFITIKRLSLAKEQLQSGVLPTQVYLLCGFNDYTSFFRAYKKKFGVSPKNHYKKI